MATLIASFVLAQTFVFLAPARAATELEAWGQRTAPGAVTLHAVTAPDENKAYAVGDTGTILATTDGGANWSAQTSGTTQSLRGITFVDPNNGWAVGYGGTVLTTSNGGGTWTVQSTPTAQAQFRSVSFTAGGSCGRPACYGHVVGWQTYGLGTVGVILATTDGGSTWQIQNAAAVMPPLNSVSFVNKDRGWAVSNEGHVLTTTDAGANWTSSKPSPSSLFGVSFTDPNNGWAAGSNIVLRTTNGGTTWEDQTSKVPEGSSTQFVSVSASKDPSCPSQVPACIVYLAGGGGKIVATRDGEGWARQYLCASLSDSCGAGSSDLISNKSVNGIARVGGSNCPPSRPVCNGFAVGAPGTGASAKTLVATNIYFEAPPPFTVTDISPGRGCEMPYGGVSGTRVKITGTNLRGAEIRFGSAVATSVTASDTERIVSVPQNTGGLIGQDIGLYISGGGVGVRKGFVLTGTRFDGQCLTVDVPSGVPGDVINLVATNGTSWGSSPSVIFLGSPGSEDDQSAQFTPETAGVTNGRAFTATVPQGAKSGPIEVRGSGGAVATHEDFIVLDPGDVPPPTISSFTPVEGTPGTEVTITGTNFRAAIVEFAGAAAVFPKTPVRSPFTTVKVDVPLGAATGPITIEATGGRTTSSQLFTARPAPPPEITSFSPQQGGVGSSVTIFGKNLLGAAVRFNEKPAEVLRTTATSVTAEVPAGATSGPIRVTTPSGTVTSATGFLVFRPPGTPAPVTAEIIDSTHVLLEWKAAAEDGDVGPPAQRYQLRHAPFPIDSSNFDSAGVTKLCDAGDCSLNFKGSSVGDAVNYVISDLKPATDYHFAVRALDTEGEVGPIATAGPIKLPPGVGGTKTTGEPSVARTRHTATLLPNGNVLVAGGFVDGAPSPTAELYNPRTGEWTPTAPMSNPRASHSATLLSDGSVLMIGGQGGARSVESFKDGAWTTWPITPREMVNHAATRLPDGKILITGGHSNCCTSPSAAAEILDPGKPSSPWTTVRSMLAARRSHKATLLTKSCGNHCGKVLVAGGDPKSEIYDPALNLWTYAGDTKITRHFASATTLGDGKVLLAGGTNVLTGGATPSAEVFDPLQADPTKSWTSVAPLDVGRTDAASAVLASGKFLVAGGNGGDIFGSGAWRSMSALQTPRPPGSTATLLSSTSDGFAGDPAICGPNCGKVLIVGGTVGARSAELFSEPPVISSVSPTTGTQGNNVTITGQGFTQDLTTGQASVLFGSVPASNVVVESYNKLTATVPPVGAARRVDVSVKTDGGLVTHDQPFTYQGAPGKVSEIAALPLSGKEIELTFSAPGMVANSHPPAFEFIVKQSSAPITDEAAFSAAQTLSGSSCPGGVCKFSPKAVGDKLKLAIGGLTPGTKYHYAVRARNDSGALGPISDDANATTTTVTPGRVTDLGAKALSGTQIELTFSAPGSDGNEGPPITDYVVRQSRSPIADQQGFEGAQPLCDGACTFSPKQVGDKITLTITDLTPGITYHYALRPRGASGALGELSNSASATTAGVSPGVVRDLAATALSGKEIQLTFSAPGANGGDPPAAGIYVVKQSRTPITDEASFDAARPLCGETCTFSPRNVGDQITLHVTALVPETTYYYALKAKNEGGALGPMSNEARATTLLVTPGAVKDLKASPEGRDNIRLTFSAPGSNGDDPPAAGAYIVKQSRSPITNEADFNAAMSLCDDACMFSPREVGDQIKLLVTGLKSSKTYYYAIRARDESGSIGPMSNVAKATTGSDGIPPGRINDLKAKQVKARTVKLVFSAPGSDGALGSPVRKYIVKQSTKPIKSNRAWKQALTLCGKTCKFVPVAVGDTLTLKVTHLKPDTTYYYRVVPVDTAGNRGEKSNQARVAVRRALR